MTIAWWQILLLTLYAGYQILDELQINSSAGSAVFAGLISGLVMGDLKTGLYWRDDATDDLRGRNFWRRFQNRC